VGEDRTARPGPTERSVTVSEAAQALGITPEAVRMRIKRGTLSSEKRAGRVYVLLGPRPTTEQTTDQTPDHTEELIRTLREQLEAKRQAHAEEPIEPTHPQSRAEVLVSSPQSAPGGVGCSEGEQRC
jgi:predicted ArsR family transcriptional regulator